MFKDMEKRIYGLLYVVYFQLTDSSKLYKSLSPVCMWKAETAGTEKHCLDLSILVWTQPRCCEMFLLGSCLARIQVGKEMSLLPPG